MYKSMSYYENIFNNISESVLLMEGQFFIDANLSALSLYNVDSKEDLILLHPSQLSPMFQPDGELSSVKANKMLEICEKNGHHTFEWLSKSFTNKVFLVEVTLNKILIDDKELIISKIRNLEIIKNLEKEISKQNETIIQKEVYIEKVNETLLSNNEDNKNLIESLVLLEEYKKALDESCIVSKTDLKGIISYVNENFCKESGYTKEELLGQNHNIIRHPDTPREFFTQLWGTINNKKVYKSIIKNKRKNGQSYYVDSTIIPILDKNNNITEYIAIRNNITSLFEKDKLIYEQFTDELTSLPNRQKLLSDLKNSINPKLAIINIDRFKDINNTYGMRIGDEILKNFTKKLMIFKSINLNVYRLSGDIFAFMAFGNFNTKELYKICTNLNKICDEENFIIEDNSFDISFTVGIADTNNKLLNHAEIALYWAKITNINIVVFNEEIPIYKELRRNVELTKEIKQALKDDNILIYGQKIIDNKTQNIKYEVLMRLRLPNGEILSPFIFLKVAKKARLYSMLTNRMIEKACEYFKDKDMKFSINLMIEDIKNEKTVDFLFSKLKETNLANKIILEIVETEGIEKFDEVKVFIRKAKFLGCEVAIDDFGTGYSNFEYIIKLDVDYIKIDGSLIKNIHVNNNVKLTVSTIVSFAKVLGIRTVAEYVHCQEVQDIVKSLGIDCSQGYLFHEPEHLISKL